MFLYQHVTDPSHLQQYNRQFLNDIRRMSSQRGGAGQGGIRLPVSAQGEKGCYNVDTVARIGNRIRSDAIYVDDVMIGGMPVSVEKDDDADIGNPLMCDAATREAALQVAYTRIMPLLAYVIARDRDAGRQPKIEIKTSWSNIGLRGKIDEVDPPAAAKPTEPDRHGRSFAAPLGSLRR